MAHDMMSSAEREVALVKMRDAAKVFYAAATSIAINEKLACIFSGGKVLDATANEAAFPE